MKVVLAVAIMLMAVAAPAALQEVPNEEREGINLSNIDARSIWRLMRLMRLMNKC